MPGVDVFATLFAEESGLILEVRFGFVLRHALDNPTGCRSPSGLLANLREPCCFFAKRLELTSRRDWVDSR
jgi:hypothetical protein